MKNGNGVAELHRVRDDLIDEGRRLVTDLNNARRRYDALVKELTEITDTKDLASALEKIRTKPKVKSEVSKRPLHEGSFVEYVDKRGVAHTALVKEVLERGMLRIKLFGGSSPDRIVDVQPLSEVRARDGWRVRKWAAKHGS